MYYGLLTVLFYCCCFKFSETAVVEPGTNMEEILNTISTAEDPGLPEDYRTLLVDITANFAENLRRAFNNQGVRNIHLNGDKPIKLQDTANSKHDVYYKLTNVNLMTYPDFRIVQLDPDLQNLFIRSNFNLGSLKIDCDFEVVNKTTFSAFTVSQFGKLQITLNDVKSQGNIGIYMEEDSFVVTTFDMAYSTGLIEMDVTDYTPTGSQTEHQTATKRDDTPVQLFWRDLVQVLDNLLYRQIGAVIVEYSASEMLIDNPDPLRTHQGHRMLKANAVFDKIVARSKDSIVAEKLTSILAEPLMMTFRQTNTSTSQRGTLVTDKCRITDLASFTRTKPVSILDSEPSNTIVYGYLGMRELKFDFGSYVVKFQDQEVRGTMKASVGTIKMLLSAVVDREGKCISSRTEVMDLRNLEVDVSGLQSLTWIQDQFKPWIVGYVNSHSDIISNFFANAVKIMAPQCPTN